jgi:hypothetical protein
MINGTIATGALCRQAELAQWAHHQVLVRCKLPQGRDGPPIAHVNRMALFASVPSHEA